MSDPDEIERAMEKMRLNLIEAHALHLWRQREMDFPVRVRRMVPDDLDRASGAWARTLRMAEEELEASLSIERKQ